MLKVIAKRQKAWVLPEDCCQTLKQLSDTFNVTEIAVSKRLHNLGLVKKDGKLVTTWFKRETTRKAKNDLWIAAWTMQKESVLHRIVAGDEKWVFYENPKRQKAWVLPGEPSPSTPKRNTYAQKVMLCIWWDQESMVYHELLKPGETLFAINNNWWNWTKYWKKAARVRQTSLQTNFAAWQCPHEAELVNCTEKKYGRCSDITTNKTYKDTENNTDS